MNILKVREFAIFVPVHIFFENDLVLVELWPHECGQVVTGVRGPNSGDLTKCKPHHFICELSCGRKDGEGGHFLLFASGPNC